MASTLNDRLEQFFRANEGVWVDGRRLSEIAGYAGWRNRITDLRLQRGLVIKNRQRRVRGAIGMMTVSEYRLVPEVSLQPVLRVSGCTCAEMAEPPCGWCDGPDRDLAVDSVAGEA